MSNLKGKRVAVLVEKLYEDLELWYPVLRCARPEPTSRSSDQGPEKLTCPSTTTPPALTPRPTRSRRRISTP